MIRRPPRPPLFPYTPLSRSETGIARADHRQRLRAPRAQLRLGSARDRRVDRGLAVLDAAAVHRMEDVEDEDGQRDPDERMIDRKSTRLNSSHLVISYAVFCL